MLRSPAPTSSFFSSSRWLRLRLTCRILGDEETGLPHLGVALHGVPRMRARACKLGGLSCPARRLFCIV